MTPIYMGSNNENDRVASPESVLIHLKTVNNYTELHSHMISISFLSGGGFVFNPFKPNGFFQSYYLEGSILHFRGVRLIFLH